MAEFFSITSNLANFTMTREVAHDPPGMPIENDFKLIPMSHGVLSVDQMAVVKTVDDA